VTGPDDLRARFARHAVAALVDSCGLVRCRASRAGPGGARAPGR
jgi:hypothetical protein